MPKAKTAAPDAALAASMPGAVMQAAAPMPGGIAIPPGAPPPLIPSSNPDQFVSTGLANNFNGRVHSMYLLPRKVEKGKKAGMYELSAEINILADDHTLGRDGIVTEYLKVDQLNQFVPSRIDPHWDGHQWVYTPAGTSNGVPATLDMYLMLAMGQTGFPEFEANGSPKLNPDGTAKTAMLPPDDWRGFFAIPGKQCSRSAFMSGTKWQQFTRELKRLEYDKKAPHVNWGDFRRFLVGVYGTWVRLPFEFSGGQAPAMQEGDRKIETLCLTSILDLGPISGAGGPSFVPAPAAIAMPAVQPAVQAPVPATAAAPVAASAPASPLGPKDPTLISANANAILTALVASRGTVGVTKAEAGTAVFEGVNAAGLDGATALRFLNDNDWMEDDERGFAYDAARGLCLPLPAGA